jgi:hypothetical protein
MKTVNNTLYVEFPELISAGLSARTLESWQAPLKVSDPIDKRKKLIHYEALPVKYKRLIEARYGNPYEYVAKSPVKEMVRRDFEAERFYTTYRFPGGNVALPLDYVERYTLAASWLNMILDCLSNKRRIKGDLNLTLEQFWTTTVDLISTNTVELPTNERRLRSKVKEYQDGGYPSLISKKFGNKNSAKIIDEAMQAVLFEMIAHPNQHGDPVIAWHYNQLAVQKGWDAITPATVGNYRRKCEYLLMNDREGGKKWSNKFAKRVPGKRPSAPLFLVNSDDNVLDLFYINTQQSGGSKFYNRLKMILVMDAFNDYPLGYAVSTEITTALVKAAYLDAAHHIRELTGDWFMPRQIITDRWALKELTPFYSSIANYFPASTGLARAKHIERAFGDDWHRVLKHFNNYSGYNISAKNDGINREALTSRRREFPTLEDAPAQIDSFIQKLRLLPSKTEELTRQGEWVKAFQELDPAEKKKISREEMLLKLGTKHEYKNTITNAGLRVTFSGATYAYNIPDHLYLENVGKTVSVVYDPLDLSHVLVTDGGGLRFVAEQQEALPRALADYREGDRAKLNAALREKINHVHTIGDAKERRIKVLSDLVLDPEALLQANVLNKEARQQAEIDYLIPQNPTVNQGKSQENESVNPWELL